MNLASTDTYGRRIGETYRIISDPTFEMRLKAYDPKLKLLFDQSKERWAILEWAYDNSGWNCILLAQDDAGKPKPLGEWIFNKLWVMRQKWEAKKQIGADTWLNQLRYELEQEKLRDEQKASDENQALIRDEVSQWRKAAKEIQGLPVSDAVAGYRKGNDYDRDAKCLERENQGTVQQPGL